MFGRKRRARMAPLTRNTPGHDNIAIGLGALHLDPRLVSNCILIGTNAGADITNEQNLVILGDNIRDASPDQPGVIYIGHKDGIRLLIGRTIGGEPLSLGSLFNIPSAR